MTDEGKIISLLGRSRTEDTTGFNGLDFVHAFGAGRDALMYSLLFWPRFEEFEGMIFLSSTIESPDDRTRVRNALEGSGRDTKRAEEQFNIVEVSYLFGLPIGQLDERSTGELAQILMDMWRCRVEALFPDTNVHFELIDPADMDGAVAFTFFQVAR